jgi:hypothetical protein
MNGARTTLGLEIALVEEVYIPIGSGFPKKLHSTRPGA